MTVSGDTSKQVNQKVRRFYVVERNGLVKDTSWTQLFSSIFVLR
jgi:hypothetical protein